MTPKAFITIGSVFGLLLGFVLGHGADWMYALAHAFVGGIVGFAMYPVGRTLFPSKRSNNDDE